MADVAELKALAVLLEDLIGANQAGHRRIARQGHRIHAQHRPIVGHIELPTHPGQGESMLEQKAIPRRLLADRIEASRRAAIEMALPPRFDTSSSRLPLPRSPRLRRNR